MTLQDMPENRDKLARSYSLRCTRCGWKFRCPVEQIDRRDYCRACQSEMDAEAAA